MKFAVFALLALVAVAQARSPTSKKVSKALGSSMLGDSSLICLIEYLSDIESAAKKTIKVIDEAKTDIKDVIATIKDCDDSWTCIVEAVLSAYSDDASVLNTAITEAEALYKLYVKFEDCLD